MTKATAPQPALKAAIFAGCMVAFLGFGFAATFCVYLQPMSHDLGWGRETFSLSVAVQLFMWGVGERGRRLAKARSHPGGDRIPSLYSHLGWSTR